jgi:hypothetical protein
MSRKKSVTPPRIDHGTVRLVAQRLKHYATPGPISTNIEGYNNSIVSRKTENPRKIAQTPMPLISRYVHFESFNRLV